MKLYKIGSKGEDVVQIQKALHLYPDGVYGPLTREAVLTFQRENGLAADGVVGPATLVKLIPLRFKKSKRKINEIIIHCSDTPEGRNFTAADIRRWHRQKGWADIGYHYVVLRNGTVENGRDVDIVGAHCKNHNTHSIGVCYIGGSSAATGKPKDTRTLAQKAALIKLLRDLKKLYPNAKILGHRDTSPDKNHNGKIDKEEYIKDCPCFDAMLEYSSIFS